MLGLANRIRTQTCLLVSIFLLCFAVPSCYQPPIILYTYHMRIRVTLSEHDVCVMIYLNTVLYEYRVHFASATSFHCRLAVGSPMLIRVRNQEIQVRHGNS
ncbi:hypothetical protein F5X98DRAFT_359451 [Xylaria grammica]|nr:hypothetical protein F5X98DRAFT_359451 [Xylaria grammica]